MATDLTSHDNVTDSKYHSGAIEVGQIYFDHHSDTNGTFECGKRIVQAADKAIRQAMEAQQADLATLGKQLENAREALDGYRAAVSFISADSWDGCSDCINILKAARCADMTDAMTINETAEHLKRIRLHYDPAALPPAPSLAAQDGLVEALERCAQIVEQWNHRQNEKVDDIKYIVRNALSAIKGDKS